jgi:ferredoxin
VTERLAVQVDPRLCEGHGICIELSPDVFDLGDSDIVTVTEESPDQQHWADVRAAVAACPRQAITLTHQEEKEQ